MAKTIKEINEKIKKGNAVIVTAEEIIDIVSKEGLSGAAEKVDVVTTGTFGPMCSSGAYFNIGHSRPKIKIGGGNVTLNDIPAYAGLAAVDIYIGAEIERLFSIRNAWLASSGKRAPYAGPQLGLYSKIFGSRLVTEMAKILGPCAFTDDAEWGLEEGMFEVGQRAGVCFAPAGTPEAQKIIMSRALAIGR